MLYVLSETYESVKIQFSLTSLVGSDGFFSDNNPYVTFGQKPSQERGKHYRECPFYR